MMKGLKIAFSVVGALVISSAVGYTAASVQAATKTVSLVSTKAPTISKGDVVVYYSVSLDGKKVTVSNRNVTLKVGQKLDVIRQDKYGVASLVRVQPNPKTNDLKLMVNYTSNVQIQAKTKGEQYVQVIPNKDLDYAPYLDVTVK